MALSKKQKNIVNPYPEDYANAQQGRRGDNYDYSSPRNKWIIEGIHDTYLNFGTFPSIGQKLTPVGPIENTDESRTISVRDAQAYAALYPQNAIVSSSRTIPALPQINPNRLGLARLAEKNAIQILDNLAERMEGIYNIATVTTVSSQKIQNQTTNTQPEDSQSPSDKASQLPDIKSTISPGRKEQIRVSFGNTTPSNGIEQEVTHTVVEGDWLSKIAITYNVPLKRLVDANPHITNPDLILPGQIINIPSQASVSPIAEADEPINSQEVPGNVRTEHNVFNQAPPEDPNPEPYYNLADKRWYYVRRTDSVNPKSYDLGEFENSAPVRENFRKLVEKGTFEILKASGKLQYVSAEERRSIEEDYATPETYYGDPGRPHAGTGRSTNGEAERPVQKRWITAVSIGGSIIDRIQKNVQNSNNSANELSSLEIVKIILEQDKTSRNAPFEIGTLKRNLKHVTRVLEMYAQVLDNEGMTPELMSGLNLEAEAEHVNSLYPIIERWLASNKITTTDNSTIEFLFDKEFSIQAITVDGTLYPEGYGLKLSEGGEPHNIFAGVSATTMGYLFYSNDIRNDIGKIGGVQMPWTSFLTMYTYPNPIIYPAAVSIKKEKDRKEGKNKTADDKKLFKTAVQARRQAQRRLDINSKDLYNTIRSSAGSCGTAQAALLRDAIQVYQIFTGKSRSRDIIALVASKIRNELINDYLTQYKLTELEAFINNPAMAVRIVEEEVNKQLFCIIDVIGDVINEQVLVPGGVPPSVRVLVAEAIVPPKGVKFKQSPTKDFMAPWRKKLEQLVFDFIKQLILSILGDVVKAALGCGPEESDDTGSKEYLKGAQIDTYGNIQINVLVDQAGDIDLVRVASDCKLINRYSRRGPQNQKIVVEEPASLDQLRQFNRDVSDILLMTETTSLLEGNASNRTIGIINEMVNRGHVDLTGLTADEKTDPLMLSERQDSLKRDDIRYASLGVTPEKIIQFYTIVGSLIAGKENLLPPVDPKEAFCNAKDPDVPAPAISGLSDLQLQTEIEGQINAKLEQVKSLCELAEMNFSFQLEIDNFIDSLPTAGYYNKFLKFISDASNAAAKAVQEALAAQVSAPAPTAIRNPMNETQLYAAATNFYSTERSRVSVALGNPDDNFTPGEFGDQRGVATPDIIWTTGNKNLNQMFFRFADDNMVSVSMNIFANGENTPWSEAVREDLFTFKLAEDNTPGVKRLVRSGEGTVVNPAKNNFSIIPQQEYTFVPNLLRRTLDDPSRIAQAPEINNYNNQANPMRGIVVPAGAGTATTVKPYGPELVAAANTYIDQAASLQTSPAIANASPENQILYRFSVLFNNQSEDFRSQITNFWLDQDLQERMLDMSQAIVQPVIKLLDTTCAETQEQLIAKATISVIQNRVANFMLNVGPLLRVYNGWNTPDTTNMITGYLAYKIEKDLRENKLWNPVLTGLEAVDKTMVDRNPPDTENEYIKFQLENYDSFDTMGEKFRYLVGEVLLGIFTSMKEKGAYPSVFENIFDLPENNPWTLWYNEFSDFVYNGNYPVSFDHPVETLEIPSFHATSPPGVNPNFWDNIDDRTAFRKISFLRYFPVPLLRGLQIIFYDRSINFLRSYAPFNFFAGQREALADDSLISALNSQHLTLYSAPYVGFPVTIDGELFYGYKDIQMRIRELDNDYSEIVKLEEMFGSTEPVPMFSATDSDRDGHNYAGLKLTPPFPPILENTNPTTARRRLFTTPYSPLATVEDGYESRAYPRLTSTEHFSPNFQEPELRGSGFPMLRFAPGVSYNRLITQSDPEDSPILNYNTKFGLADGLKGQGRRTQKLSWHEFVEEQETKWANTFEGMIYKLAWDSWTTMPQNKRNAIIKQALITPYVEAMNGSILQAATERPAGIYSYRTDLALNERFKPWAALERQRLLYGVEYDIGRRISDANFLEAFSNYSIWPESNGDIGRSDDYEELHYLNDDTSPLWEDYSTNDKKALFDVDWSTEWFYNFTSPEMADAMIKFYNGDATVYDTDRRVHLGNRRIRTEDIAVMRTRQATSGAVLDKVGINHLYLQLAEQSVRDKPSFDRENLNSKINKLQAFLDNRE